MTNLPPGVTGNEDEIAGPAWEGEVVKTCGREEVEFNIVTPDARRMVQRFGLSPKMGLVPDSDKILQFSAGLAAEHMLFKVTADCPFEGEVLVQRWRQARTETWECPACGYEHEEELDDDQ